MDYPQTLNGIYIGSVYLHEPGGFVTNLGLLIFSLVYFFWSKSHSTAFAVNWRYFFLSFALASFGGLFTHGFPTWLGPKWFTIIWLIKNSFVSVGNSFAILALAAAYRVRNQRLIIGLMVLKCSVVMMFLYKLNNFLPAAIDLGVTYIVLIFISGYRYRSSLSMRYIFWAFISAVFSGIWYIVKFDVHYQWLTHKDLVHIGAYISLWFVYKSIRCESPPA